MQRILQPGEIEALDRTRMPHARLPQPQNLYAERAARLLQKADDSPIGDYLRFIARLVQAQAALTTELSSPAWPQETIDTAIAHAMPLCNAADAMDAQWQTVLERLLQHLEQGSLLPPALQEVITSLRASTPEALDALAKRALAQSLEDADLAAAPLIMAALQLVFTHRASQLQEHNIPYTQPMTVCPVCSSLPVASVLRISGADGGLRFLHCGVCSTEWHMVRVKCSHCESTAGIQYQGAVAEAGDVSKEVVLAETCDQCHTYRKMVNQEKDPLAEPLADDLASLTLDLLMGETEFSRASANPFLALRMPAVGDAGTPAA